MKIYYLLSLDNRHSNWQTNSLVNVFDVFNYPAAGHCDWKLCIPKFCCDWRDFKSSHHHRRLELRILPIIFMFDRGNVYRLVCHLLAHRHATNKFWECGQRSMHLNFRRLDGKLPLGRENHGQLDESGERINYLLYAWQQGSRWVESVDFHCRSSSGCNYRRPVLPIRLTKWWLHHDFVAELRFSALFESFKAAIFANTPHVTIICLIIK